MTSTFLADCYDHWYFQEEIRQIFCELWIRCLLGLVWTTRSSIGFAAIRRACRNLSILSIRHWRQLDIALVRAMLCPRDIVDTIVSGCSYARLQSTVGEDPFRLVHRSTFPHFLNLSLCLLLTFMHRSLENICPWYAYRFKRAKLTLWFSNSLLFLFLEDRSTNSSFFFQSPVFCSIIETVVHRESEVANCTLRITGSVHDCETVLCEWLSVGAFKMAR